MEDWLGSNARNEEVPKSPKKNDKERNRLIGEVFRIHEKTILSYLQWKFGISREKAEDALADACVNIMKSDSEKIPLNHEGMKAFIFQSCRNAVIDQHRKQGRYEGLDLNAKARLGPFDDPEMRVMLAGLIKLIEALPECEKVCIKGRLGGYTPEEISARTGYRISTVYQCIHSAKKRLKEAIEQDKKQGGASE